jgi:hypothetical protein
MFLKWIKSMYGRAVAQVVSRRHPTATAWVRARVKSCGLCDGHSDTGTGFLTVLRFTLLIIHPTNCGFHGDDYEECRLLGYRNPVRTSQETYYVSVTVSNRLMLCKIWGFHGGDYEECRILGQTPSSYLTGDTIRLHYWVQPVNAM